MDTRCLTNWLKVGLGWAVQGGARPAGPRPRPAGGTLRAPLVQGRIARKDFGGFSP